MQFTTTAASQPSSVYPAKEALARQAIEAVDTYLRREASRSAHAPSAPGFFSKLRAFTL